MHVRWNFFRVYIVLVVGPEQQMTDQVQKDKDARACTESYMNTTRLYAEALAHRTLHIKDIVHVLIFENIGNDFLKYFLIITFEHKLILACYFCPRTHYFFHV